MNTLFTFLLGANWRTTLSGWITVLASAIAINPGLVAFLPESVRTYVTGMAGLMAVVSGGAFALNAKDKQVTGGSVPNDPANKSNLPVLPLLIFVPVLAFLIGCSTLQSWQANPKVQSAENIALQLVENCALNAGAAAIDQYVTTGNIDGKAVAAGALNGAAYQLRSLETTSAATNPAAVSSAVQDGSGVTVVSQTVAPVVSSAVQAAVNQGASPDAALEKAASALDQAAANSTK
jgi:hypothetical protein